MSLFEPIGGFPKPWILVVDTAPRTKKRRYLICRAEPCGIPEHATVYEVWAVADYEKEAVERVAELNRRA